MADEIQVVADEYLRSVKTAKNSQAVLKVQFATFASTVSEQYKIFAYEGVGDKSVYYHWIKSIRPEILYEPYECKNKTNALRLFDILERDLTGLGARVFYFVDKDYDGLQGRSDNAKIYVTEKYSIENYFVCEEVLDDLLKMEFHCNGSQKAREEIIEKFEGLYDQFLELTTDINFRIFLSRKLSIRQAEDLPTGINSLVNITLNEIQPSGKPSHELVKIEREPTEAEIAQLITEFESLEPRNDFRGKFALLFFVKVLMLLRDDRNADESVNFSKVPKTTFLINGSFTLTSLAPKTAPPPNLPEFLAAI